ncbi:hypothetical protein [Herbaspirillum huttiense]|uniref:hypothetical protein n=1 Tax=Herbaspirillum huttiense TaxID=863372 RepID=UPI0031DCAE91
MITDRELLEMATKAAGIVIDKSPANGGGNGNTGFDLAGNAMLDWHSGAKWNPLEDDGDAFRLLRQVDYGLLVEDGTVKIMNKLGGCVFFADINGTDEMSVIRRAITSAAAAKAWSQP